MSEQDIILQYSTFSFDASVYDIFGSLACGSRLHLLTDEQRFSIDAFTEAVAETKATRVAILPTVFLINWRCICLWKTHINTGISRRSSSEGKRWPEKPFGCSRKVADSNRESIRPNGNNGCSNRSCRGLSGSGRSGHRVYRDAFANYELYIVNEHNELCPTCVTGESLICSVGVAKGYLNQPEKTKEAFILDPITPESGKQYYRSGDLVRLSPNGQVEYRGRKDSQVKIRGFRIEIGEIEDNLAKHEQVKDIAVIPRMDEDGTKMLAAFYTTHDGQADFR